MDDEKLATEAQSPTKPAGRGLSKGPSFLTSVSTNDAPDPKTAVAVPPDQQTMSSPEPGERDGVFRQLVREDADIAGLVAYSIYKQNKLDWLTAFEQAKGRSPNADELASYIIGEGTSRRLVTYRHLAEAMLAGNGPEVGGGAGSAARGGVTRRTTAGRNMPALGLIAAYAVVAVLFVVGFFLAAHYTMSSR